MHFSSVEIKKIGRSTNPGCCAGFPGSVEEVPDADEGPSTVQVSHGSVDDCLVAVMHSVGVLRTYGVQWGHLGAGIDCVPMLWDSW